jgi:hypothetical protein
VYSVKTMVVFHCLERGPRFEDVSRGFFLLLIGNFRPLIGTGGAL